MKMQLISTRKEILDILSTLYNIPLNYTGPKKELKKKNWFFFEESDIFKIKYRNEETNKMMTTICQFGYTNDMRKNTPITKFWDIYYFVKLCYKGEYDSIKYKFKETEQPFIRSQGACSICENETNNEYFIYLFWWTQEDLMDRLYKTIWPLYKKNEILSDNTGFIMNNVLENIFDSKSLDMIETLNYLKFYYTEERNFNLHVFLSKVKDLVYVEEIKSWIYLINALIEEDDNRSDLLNYEMYFLYDLYKQKIVPISIKQDNWEFEEEFVFFRFILEHNNLYVLSKFREDVNNIFVFNFEKEQFELFYGYLNFKQHVYLNYNPLSSKDFNVSNESLYNIKNYISNLYKGMNSFEELYYLKKDGNFTDRFIDLYDMKIIWKIENWKISATFDKNSMKFVSSMTEVPVLIEKETFENYNKWKNIIKSKLNKLDLRQFWFKSISI